MDVVNEGTSAYLTVTFLTKAGTQQAPQSVSYRIDDLGSGQQIRGDTSVAPGGSVEITLTPSDNAILAAGNTQERRLVTVTASYGAQDGIKADYVYQVKNLAKVT